MLYLIMHGDRPANDATLGWDDAASLPPSLGPSIGRGSFDNPFAQAVDWRHAAETDGRRAVQCRPPTGNLWCVIVTRVESSDREEEKQADSRERSRPPPFPGNVSTVAPLSHPLPLSPIPASGLPAEQKQIARFFTPSPSPSLTRSHATLKRKQN